MLNTQKRTRARPDATRQGTLPKVSPESSACGVYDGEGKSGRGKDTLCLRSVTVVNRKRMSVAGKVTNVMKYSIGQHQQRPTLFLGIHFKP